VPDDPIRAGDGGHSHPSLAFEPERPVYIFALADVLFSRLQPFFQSYPVRMEKWRHIQVVLFKPGEYVFWFSVCCFDLVYWPEQPIAQN